MQTHYELLGVSPTASYAEIKEKYFKLIKEIHPDSHSPHADGEKAKLINSAWAVLKDSEARRAYDESLQLQQGQSNNLDPKEIAIRNLAEKISLLYRSDCHVIKNLFPVNPKMDPFLQDLVYGLERSLFLDKVRDLSLKMVNEINAIGMLTFINQTTDMLNALLTSPADPKLYKKIMLGYAEKFLFEHDQHPAVKSLAGEVDKILKNTIKLKLYNVHSALLDQEADRIKNIFAAEPDKTKKKKGEDFADTLKNVASYANNVAEDLKNKKTNRDEILASDAVLFAKDTLSTVKLLEFNPEKLIQDKNRLINYGNAYYQKAKEPGRFRNFFKAVGTVVTMGVDAILCGSALGVLGGLVGALWGGLIGSWVGPEGSVPGALIGLGICGGGAAILGFSSGLQIGYEHGRSWTNFDGYSIIRALAFMPQDLRPELSKKIVEKGEELLCPKVSKSWFGCFSHKKQRAEEPRPLNNSLSLVMRKG